MKKTLLFIALLSFISYTQIYSHIVMKGNDVAQARKKLLKKKLTTANLTRPPHLAIIQVEDQDPSKDIYIRRKKQACEQMGFDVSHILLSSHTTKKQLIQLIHTLNNKPCIDGMIVQLPLPATFDQWQVVNAIAPHKDIDGLSPTNMGNLKRHSQKGITPATAKGILKMLKHYEIKTNGKECVIVGGSELVGHPLQILLSREDSNVTLGGATVTLCHKHTKDLAKHTRQADILIVAAGCPGLITADMVKKGAVIIDAGINRQGKKIVGDVAFNEVAPKCSAITPVPGGVGPMTVASLLENLAQAAIAQK